MYTVSASQIGGGRRRRPKTYARRRRCEAPHCTTIISRYNSSDFCFNHAPPTFRRLRGVVGDDR